MHFRCRPEVDHSTPRMRTFTDFSHFRLTPSHVKHSCVVEWGRTGYIWSTVFTVQLSQQLLDITRKPALEVAPTSHFSNILADRQFSAGCYLFTVFNSGLLFSHYSPSQKLLSCCFPPATMTLTFELDLNSVEMNQRAKYLGQRSCSSKIITRIGLHRQTHTRPTAVLGPTKVLGNEGVSYLFALPNMIDNPASKVCLTSKWQKFMSQIKQFCHSYIKLKMQELSGITFNCSPELLLSRNYSTHKLPGSKFIVICSVHGLDLQRRMTLMIQCNSRECGRNVAIKRIADYNVR